MKDCMNIYLEIFKLIKFSQKYENSIEGLKLGEVLEAKSYDNVVSN